MKRSKYTPRLKELIRLIALGDSFDEIAFEWHRSRKTVEWHWSELKKRFGFRCYQDVTRYAIRHKIITA